MTASYIVFPGMKPGIVFLENEIQMQGIREQTSIFTTIYAQSHSNREREGGVKLVEFVKIAQVILLGDEMGDFPTLL